VYDYLHTATLPDLEDRLKDILQRTKDTKEAWAKSPSKASINVQNLMSKFSDFLACYSGTVEIVKGAGQQYGAMAYRIMSLLLTVSCCAHGERLN